MELGLPGLGREPTSVFQVLHGAFAIAARARKDALREVKVGTLRCDSPGLVEVTARRFIAADMNQRDRGEDVRLCTIWVFAECSLELAHRARTALFPAAVVDPLRDQGAGELQSNGWIFGRDPRALVQTFQVPIDLVVDEHACTGKKKKETDDRGIASAYPRFGTDGVRMRVWFRPPTRRKYTGSLQGQTTVELFLVISVLVLAAWAAGQFLVPGLGGGLTAASTDVGQMAERGYVGGGL